MAVPDPESGCGWVEALAARRGEIWGLAELLMVPVLLNAT